MLVLTRKSGERVICFADARRIVIEVLDCQNGRVRLGIDAPPDVVVHREEIERQIGSARTRPAAIKTRDG